jgi:origin recognition complex subunit 1
LKFGEELLTSGDFVKTSSESKIFGQITYLFEENNTKNLEIRIFHQLHQNELIETYEYSIINPSWIECKVAVNKDGGFICDKLKLKDGSQTTADKDVCHERSMIHSKISKKICSNNSGLRKAINLLTLSAAPSNLVGRHSERQEIKDFLTTSINMNHSTSSLYICGMPGTGKTATFLFTIDQMKNDEEFCDKFEFIHVNCMKLTKPHEIYSIVCKEACHRQRTGHEALEKINNYLKNTVKKTCFVILVDEIDALMNKKQDVLYNLFNWTNIINSNFIVVGIANTMDLSDKFLHKVSSRMGNKQLVFAPYTRDQLQDIITKRLRDTQAFSTDSILFCSAKVASYSGDARRAFQVCKKAAFLALEQKQSQIGIDHIQKAFKQLFASVYVQAIQALPLRLKLVLAALCMELKNNNREVTVVERIKSRFTGFCENTIGISSIGLKQLQVIVNRLASLHLVNVDGESVRLAVTPDDVIDGIKTDQELEKVVMFLQGN